MMPSGSMRTSALPTEVSHVNPAARPIWRAALWLLLLGPVFFISYGWANNWSAQQAFVPSLWFDWERHIPFWDWTILPYMSIDAFYALSLFICTSRAELDTHAKRLLCATVLSVAGFWLFPLQFAFTRPETSGFNGMLFEVLSGFDKPFNQAPSLHISLLMLLWVCYGRHLRGVALWLLHGWFFLIGVSVFTTYQHHIMDGVGGVVAGLLCLYLLPDGAVKPDSVALHHLDTGLNPADTARRWQLARRYFAAGVACCLPAYVWGGWAWLALWPGFALLLVGLAYAGFGVAVFQKKNGRLSAAARVLLAPYRLGAWGASRWFSRHDAPCVQVAPGVWIGRAPGRGDWAGLPKFAAVLDLTAEFNGLPRVGAGAGAGAGACVAYASVPMLDLLAPTQAQLAQALAALARLHAQSQAQAGGAPVLVHCALGYSRSALAAAAWLLQRGEANSVPEVLAHIKAVRPHSVLPTSSVALLAAV